MGEQGKRLLLAVALALGVMLLWNALFPPAKKDEPRPTLVGSGSDATTLAARTGETPRSAVGVPLLATDVPAEAAPWGTESRLTMAFPNAIVTFTNQGGAIASWKLTDKRYQHDRTKGEIVSQQPGTGALQLNFANSNVVLPAHAMWTGEQLGANQVRYTYASPAIAITKTFTVEAAAYLVRLDVEYTIKSGTAARQRLAVTSFGYQDPKDDGGGGRSVQPRAWESATVRNGTAKLTTEKKVAEHPRMEQDITWTGFEHPFLMFGMAPVRGANDASVYEKHTYAVTATPGLMQTDLYYPNVDVVANGPTQTSSLVAYLGPKNYEQLAHADDVAGFSTGFKKTIDLGMFKFIGRPLLWLMQRLHDVSGNWGVAIILLTLLVKLATLYWTTKSMRSMKAMAALAPKMKELQAKYADDKARQQQETMALYKTHGVSPLAGCLPILLQMPIWLALYRMLSTAGELYLQPFVGGWIDDLTNTDPYHILPVMVTITMFLQSRLTPATGDQMQQKIMMYLMPLMFGVMGFFFPAGLSLYIFTNTCLSALHSYYMKKYDGSSHLPVTAAGAAAAASKVIDADSNDVADDDTTDDEPKAAGLGSSPARSKRKPARKR